MERISLFNICVACQPHQTEYFHNRKGRSMVHFVTASAGALPQVVLIKNQGMALALGI
jgi:hypothetical protein